MPRYYFNTYNGGTHLDVEGVVFPDVYAAQTQAIRTSGELLRDLGAKFWDGTEWRLEIADAQRRILFVLRFSAEERLPGALPPEDAQSGAPGD